MPDGAPLELLPLLAPYGRDRRVALRIERMPSRARLSRGRNNGDGSWSLTRDELEDLRYLPPNGATEMPTLVVRIIGLDSDNGATLAVLDHAVLRESEAAGADTGEETELAPQHEAELRELRAELTKARAALRTTRSELASARNAWDAELEQRLNDAADEAVATLEERRSVWMTETKDRLLKSEARGIERLEQARERWRHDTETELAKAEDVWKSGESMRLAAAEAHWQEQTARALARETAQLTQLEAALAAARVQAASKASDSSEIQRLREELGGLKSTLADAQIAAERALEKGHAQTAAAVADAERAWKTEETKRRNAAEKGWREQTSRALADEAAKRDELEASLAEARLQAAAGVSENSETERLRADVSTLKTALAERERALAEEQAAARRAGEQASRTLADEAVKRCELEAALAEARVQAAAGVSENSEFERLRTDVSTLKTALAGRERALAEEQAARCAREQDANDAAAALANAEELWKAAEAERLKSAEAGWQEQATRRTKEMASRLAQAEAALAEVNSGRERRETAETRRLRAELSVLRENHAESEQRLAEAGAEAERFRNDAEVSHAALARAEEAWKKNEAPRFAAAEARWQEQSARVLADLNAKLERADSTNAQLRAGTKQTREKQETAELRRLNEALAEAKSQLAERESDLEATRAAAKSDRENARREFDRALAEEKKAWEAEEASRLADSKAQWKEQSDRLFKKATVRLEGAEAALADARAEANAARDRRDSAELRRLRSEFAALRAQLAGREADLAEAQVAAGRARERTREEVEAALLKAEETWKSGEAIRIGDAETRERERGGRALTEAVARLERTEAALAEARQQFEAERERAAIAAAEGSARQERTESALQAARNRIDGLRDPANETELARLRTELATLQVAHGDREAELAQTRAGARKSRESWAERTQAAVQRAEDLWRIEEAQRLEAARREWQRDARLAGVAEMAPEPDPAALRKANRLAFDSALAVGLAAIVVLGITFYPRLQPYLPALPGSGGSATATTVAPARSAKPAKTAAAHAVVGISLAKLRSDPSPTAAILATLARGTSVQPMEQRGIWTHVRVDATTTTPAREGWVHATSLKQSADR